MTDALSITNLVIEYGSRGLFGSRATPQRAVDDVSLGIAPGRTFGLVGESGSGKTSIVRALLLFAPITQGSAALAGEDIRELAKRDIRRFRRSMQMVFQQPGASLDPRMRVGESIAEPLRYLDGLSGRQLRARVDELLELVGLDSDMSRRFPRQLSEGQRQRIAIARAIAPKPAVLLADEPTSSLDVSVQAQILNLLRGLQIELNLTMLFISHNLATVRQVADEIGVMHRGRLVEIGRPEQVLTEPKSEYAKSLIAAIPVLPETETGLPATLA